MNARWVAMLCLVLSSAPLNADPLPFAVAEWLRANNVSDETQREQIIDHVVSVDYASHNMDGTRLGDRDGFKEYLSGAHNAFEGYRLEVLDSAQQEDRVWLRLSASGKHVGPLMGIDPSHNNISLGLVVILQIEGRQITKEWQLSDMASLNRQLKSAAPSH